MFRTGLPHLARQNACFTVAIKQLLNEVEQDMRKY